MPEFKNLNVLYYITSGLRHKRMYEGKPFYVNYPLKNKETKFNLELIQSIIKGDKIDISIIDDYRYLNKSKNGFIKIKESLLYPIESDELILEIHFRNPALIEIDNTFNNMLYKMKELDDIKNLNKNNKKEAIDFYYLYASPILAEDLEESYKPIKYHYEMKNIIKIFDDSKQEYNCIFECANEKEFRNALIKQPTILHISSHGYMDEKREYSLYLEEKGVIQKIYQKRLEQILSTNSNALKNIDLVFVSTCYSQILGKLFIDNGIKNVIYIHGMTPVSDKAATRFSANFYAEIIRGNTIEEAFNKAQALLQSDREKQLFQINRCCCNHWHTSKKICPLKKSKTSIHNKFHTKICECEFDEYNIHENNCKLIQLIESEKAEKNFYFEQSINNTIKICCICCKENNNNEMLPHEESSKFILESNNKNKTNFIFRYRKKGQLHLNRNAYIIKNEDFSTVGRRKQVKQIYDIIDGVNIDIHFIIIHGAPQVGKSDFAESVCIYLFERKIINDYYTIDIKESKEELFNKVKEITDNEKKANGKYIIIVEIKSNSENPIELLNEILCEKRLLNPYIYYIIIISTKDDKIDYSIRCYENKYEIIYLNNLNKTSAKELLINLCDHYHYILDLKNLMADNHLEELLELTKYSRKKINELAELIGKHYSFEKIKEIIQSEDSDNDLLENEIRLLMEKDICTIYFLLSILPNGLPLPMLNLCEKDSEKIIKNLDEKKLIYKEPKTNWYKIKNIYKRLINDLMPEEKGKECICKCFEIYSKLFFYYIESTRQKVCFPDCDIHYQFNSYNDKGLWKTFDLDIFNFYFSKNKEEYDIYKNIIKDDFFIDNHKDNIFTLIKKNVDIIKEVIFKERNVELNECLNQILLMLPSAYIGEKISSLKFVIKYCIYFCEQLKESEDNNLLKSKQRLNLFLLSTKTEKIQLTKEDYYLLGDEGEAEALFICGLKNKDVELFLKAIKLYHKLKNIELNNRISYAYYEIGCIYLSKKDFKQTESNLELAKKYAKNDDFLTAIINIKLALAYEEKYHSKDAYESYLNEVIENCQNIDLINKATNLKIKFNQKFESDIVMLNANPLIKKDNYSLLHNSIWANHNNQYYILQKLYTSLNSTIRIKSIVLNEYNLRETFNEKGKILIIQSDDFNEEGEIMLETSNGEGESLSRKKLKGMLPEKIGFEIVILCFIKSGKLIDLFKGKVKYLITFDDINCEDIDYSVLYKYNELSIDFLINFIRNYIEYNYYEQSYSESLQTFKTNIKNIIENGNNYITLNIYNENNNIMNQEKTEIIKIKDKVRLVYPLLDIPIIDLRNKDYSDDILYLIRLILSGKHIINIYAKNDIPKKIDSKEMNAKTIISFEIMRFLYRHHKFNGNIFYISTPNPKKDGYTLIDMTTSIMGKKKEVINVNDKKSFLNETDTAFIVINNYEKLYKIQKRNNKKGFFDDLKKNVQYLIISKKPIDNAFKYEIIIKDKKKNNIKNDKQLKNSKRNNKSKMKKDSYFYKIFDSNDSISPLIENRKESKLKKNQLKETFNKNYGFSIIENISGDSSNSDNSLQDDDYND